jgi:hypothetical protein
MSLVATSPIRVVAAGCTVAIVLTTAAAWTVRPLHATPRTPGASPDRAHQLISALDGCIQARFKDVDEGFGFRRIVKPGETPHRFKPENVGESDAVSRLESARLRVVLYLTGRRVLELTPETAPGSGSAAWNVVKGPVLVTSVGAPAKDAPLPSDLWEDSRRAMLAFAGADSYDFTIKDWTFSARPVRASDAGCLRCHVQNGVIELPPRPGSGASLQLGDALGAVVYGYQQIRED